MGLCLLVDETRNLEYTACLSAWTSHGTVGLINPEPWLFLLVYHLLVYRSTKRALVTSHRGLQMQMQMAGLDDGVFSLLD